MTGMAARDLAADLTALDPKRRQLLELLLSSEGSDPSLLPIMRQERGGEPIPLSSGQLGLWLFDQARPGSADYNMPLAVRLVGIPDLAALARAFDEVVARHEILRTTFESRHGEPAQVVAPSGSLKLGLVDLTRLRSTRQERELARQGRAQLARPFDLGHGPLLRAALLRLRADEHALVVVMHHIIGDHWSTGVLLRELGACYGAARQGRRCPLPAPPIQYADFAAWQRRRLAEPSFEEHLEYFRRHLAGAPLFLELPSDRPRPARPTGRGAVVVRELPAALAADLEVLAGHRQASLFMVLLSAFEILLHRVTGRRRILLGTPVAGRHRPETRDVIGFFVNTLVLSCEVESSQGFNPLLRQVKHLLLQGLDHQEVPFYRLLEELRPGRDARFHPLYQVMFTLQDEPVPRRFADLAIDLLDVHPGASQVDLTLTVARGPAGLRTIWEYSRDLFDATRIARMAEHFRRLLAAVAADPGRPVGRLSMLSAAQRAQLLSELAAAPWQPPSPGYLAHQAFAAQAARRPEAVAVELNGRYLTFGELEQSANGLAHRLRRAGAGPEVRIALYLERGMEMVVGLLGILKAGATYLPLDPKDPVRRTAFMLRDAGTRLVVTRNPLHERLETAAATVVAIDGGVRAERRRAAPDVALGATNLAYVIYTSGSTGRPKGVAVPHGPARRHLELWRRDQQITARDRVCQFSSLSFDASLEEVLSTLLAGACLVLRGPEVPSAEDFVRWADERRVSTLYLSAAYWRQVTEVWAGARNGARGTRIRLVSPSGDVMAPESVRRFQRSPLAAARLVNAYGPTEIVITATTYEVPRGLCDRHLPERVAIGRPFGERAIYLLDRRGEPVPLGVPAELCVGGAMLARGYLGRPRRTAERFVPNPFRGRPGARLYRSGDMVSRSGSGDLDFLGRVDHQVKVRGFRVELGEVEAALHRLPLVRQAAVVRWQSPSGDTMLVAYVTLEPPAGGEPAGSRPAAEPHDQRELRRGLSASLPGYMIPSRFIVLDELPLTASGKLDRAALGRQTPPDADTEAAVAPPRNTVEETLATIWADVLGRPQVGIHDDFFNLGGDSILSLQIITRLQAAGLRLTPAQFFDHPTVAQLASVAERLSGEPDRKAAPPTGPIELLPIQHWFFAQRFAQPDHWNQGVLLELDFSPRPDRLRRATALLARQHEALRLRFAPRGESWNALPGTPGDTVPVLCADLTALPSPARETAVRRLVARIQASLDLRQGPLWRVALIRRRPRPPDLLLLVCHHLIVDGVSWRILLSDLQATYQQLTAGPEADRPPSSTSLRTWAARLKDLAAGEELLAELPYWLSTGEPTGICSVCPPPAEHLPAKHPRGGETVGASSTITVRLDARRTRRLLEEAPRAYHSGVPDLLLTPLVQTFGRRCGGRLLVELEGHGREDLLPGIDLSRTVGWLTSRFPVRLDLSALADPAAPGEALPAIKEQLRQVPRRGIGFGLLAYLCPRPEVARQLRELPPPAVSFNYLGRFDRALPGGWPARLLAGGAGAEIGPENRLPSPLEVLGMVVAGELELRFTFSPDRYEATAMAELIRDFEAALDALIEHCSSRQPGFTPSDFPLAGLDADGLASLTAAHPSPADVYPLSPVQHGMLFHSLAAPQSGVYVEQVVCTFESSLTVDTLRAAWQRVVDHHAMLRTAFVWRGMPEPLQVVAPDVALPVAIADWRRRPAPEQDRELERWLERDRRRGFDLERPPLMRLFMARLGERRHCLVWTIHHLLIDGWAEPVVLKDFFAVCQALDHSREVSLPPRRPYRDYIAWLKQQDHAAARSFWRRTLRGFTRAHRLPRDPAADGRGHHDEETRLSPRLTRAVGELCRGHGLTLNSLVQGLWALLLGHACDTRDVVLGLTISGRPADLSGAEETVGMFINTLPLRARVTPLAPAIPWLRQLQGHTARLLEYGYSSLVAVKEASEVPAGEPLFETIVVFMNLPRDFSAIDPGALGDSRLLSMRGIEQTNYPLTLTAWSEERLLLQINYDTSRFLRATARGMLHDLETLLAALAERPELRLAQLHDELEAGRRRRQETDAERLRAARRQAFSGLKRRRGQRPQEVR